MGKYMLRPTAGNTKIGTKNIQLHASFLNLSNFLPPRSESLRKTFN